MSDVWHFLLTVGAWLAGLIFAYQVLTHGDAVVSIFRSVGGFVTAETQLLTR